MADNTESGTILQHRSWQFCGLHSGDGCTIPERTEASIPNPICVLQVMRLVRVADKKVKELSEMLQASLKAHDVQRVQARIRRHNLTPAVSQTQSRAVTVLNSNDIVGMLRH